MTFVADWARMGPGRGAGELTPPPSRSAGGKAVAALRPESMATAVRSSGALLAPVLAGLSFSGGVYVGGVLSGPDAPAAPPPVSLDWRPLALAPLEPKLPTAQVADEQTLQCPVFFRSRPQTPAKFSSAAEKPKETFVAAETTPLSVSAIVHQGANAYAFVSTGSSDSGWYRVGEKIMEWTIAEIGPADLTVTSGDKRARVKLHPDDDPNAAPEPLSPSPPTSARTNLKHWRRS